MELIDVFEKISVFAVLLPMLLVSLYVINTNGDFGKRSRNDSLSFMSKAKWNICLTILVGLLFVDLFYFLL